MRIASALIVLAVFALPALSQEERRRPPPPPPSVDPPKGPHGPKQDLERLVEDLARTSAELREMEKKLQDLAASGKQEEAEATKRRMAELQDVLQTLEARRADMEERMRRNPGGEPGMPPGPMVPGRGPATKEDVERAKKWAKENDPDTYADISRLEAERPEEASRRWMHLAHEVRDLTWMKDHDPERFESRMKLRKLEARSMELTGKVKQAQGSEREDVKAELKGVLGELFDLREADKLWELKRLEEELGRLKEAFDKRRAAKEKIVERRLEELTGDASDLDWDGGPTGKPPDSRR